ncbi:MAG: AAA domain-containing protein [Anaerolineales bacterium]|nr:AAA domain-containing protein [Anaerolineales bacterium]
MRFDKFTERAQDAAMRAYEILQRYQHSQADTEHLLLALLEQPNGLIPEILEKMGIESEMVMARLDQVLSAAPKVGGMVNMAVGQVYITPRLKRVLDNAQEEAKNMQDEYISTEHLFLAVCSERGTPSARILQEVGVTKAKVVDTIEVVRGGQKVTSPQAETRYRTLEKYSRDLTQMAVEGKLDPVIGRDDEILRLIQVLCRRTKNNPVLIGEAGVGKTAIVEGLAQKIASDDVPELLMNRRVVSLDLGAMIAGSRFRGEFEERLKNALEEIQRAQGEIILFIDELHTVVGAGAAQGAVDASNMMKPALARGELRCIGATTLDEFRKYIEKDPALERRFAPIYVEEPTVEEAIEMLRGLKHRYEAHHNVTYTDDAITSAARLSHRYVTDRHLPDKAIDLIDEAASKLRVAIYSMPEALKEKKKRVTKLQTDETEAGQRQDWEHAARIKAERLRMEEEFQAERDTWRQEKNLDEVVEVSDIAQVVANWTGIPVHDMLQTEAEKLLHMEGALHQRIIGQEEAINAISDAIRRSRSGLKDPRRPTGSFLFLGSSGVGKTELAKTLAWFLFDDEDALLRIDMSEYREGHTTSRLFGAPPGYVGYDEGGQLTEAVRRRPYQVVLFDEIEKAHPDVWNALLQILEDGRLTDGQGHMVDFSNTVIIMTSNLGTAFGPKGGTLGFRQRGDRGTFEDTRQKGEIEDALRRHFRPEFLNRIDEIIIFHTLTQEQVVQIVDLQMQEIGRRLGEHQVNIELTGAARTWLAEQGFDPAFGARPLRRTLQKQVESPLSVRMLRGDFKAGDTIVVDYNEVDGLVFVRRDELMVEVPSNVEMSESE